MDYSSFKKILSEEDMANFIEDIIKLSQCLTDNKIEENVCALVNLIDEWAETAEILSDPDLMRQIKKAENEIRNNPIRLCNDVLYGEDANAVLRQIEKKLTPEQINKAKARSEYFKKIDKKGL